MENRFVLMEYAESGECEISTGMAVTKEDGTQELPAVDDWVIGEEIPEDAVLADSTLEDILLELASRGNHLLELQWGLKENLPKAGFVLLLYSQGVCYEIGIGKHIKEKGKDVLEAEKEWYPQENKMLETSLEKLIEAGKKFLNTNP